MAVIELVAFCDSGVSGGGGKMRWRRHLWRIGGNYGGGGGGVIWGGCGDGGSGDGSDGCGDGGGIGVALRKNGEK